MMIMNKLDSNTIRRDDLSMMRNALMNIGKFPRYEPASSKTGPRYLDFDIKALLKSQIPFDPKMWDAYKMEFLASIDHYPNHWLLHFMHACEIVGYKHF